MGRRTWVQAQILLSFRHTKKKEFRELNRYVYGELLYFAL